MSFVEGVKSDLNKIRKEPATFQKLFRNMRNTFERFKGKNHPVVKETEEFIDYLGKAAGIVELKVSNALIKAAEKRLDTIEQLGRFEKEPQSALMEYASRYGKGHSVVHELIDDGAQEPEEVLSRLMMHEEDKERINRKVVFDPKILFIGVGHRQVDDKHLTVIFFADKIQDLPERPMNIEILERINRIRTKPISYMNDFQVAQKIYGRVKNSFYLADECKAVQSLLSQEKVKTELELNDKLNEIAKSYVERVTKAHKSNIIDVNELIDASKKVFAGYKFIVGVGTYNIFDPDKFILNLFINDFDNNKVIRQTILNKETKYVGIHYETVNYLPITIIIFTDNVAEPQGDSFSDAFVNKLNQVRTTPKEMVEALKNLKGSIEKFRHKQGQVQEINGLVKSLENLKKLSPFISSEPLSEAAEEFLRINGKQTSVFDNRVYAEEKEFLETRLSHYCTGFKEVFQFIHIGNEDLIQMIMSVMLDEKDENRNFTKVILNDKPKFVGAAKSTFKGKTIVTFIVADNVQVLKDKEFVDGLFEEINIIRRTPKSYIKFIETLREETPQEDVTKITHASKMITYLKSTRFYGPLQHSDLLTQAALSRIAVMKELKQVKKHSLEDIKVFLSDHCSGYFNVAEIVAQGYDVPNTFLSNVLVNEEFDTGARSYVFNPRLYWVGVAHDTESKITVVLFADNVEEKKDDGIYVHTHWRKINRPELSEDEILQIRKDFTKLDVTNRGTIFPQHILVMMNKNTEFQKRNPVYYNAFKNNSDNILYEQSGINVDQFIEECRKIIADFDNERWKSIFLNYVNDPKKKVIDYEIFRNITQSLGYHISDEECLEIMKKLSDENAALDLNKFTQIMNIVENKN